MDRSINLLLGDAARNLLTLSKNFEIFVPDSHQDGIHTLFLLSQLAEVTKHSLQPKSPEPIQAQAKSPQQSLACPSAPQSSPIQRTVRDQTLLDALSKLRNSKTARRRSPGMFATIIRADSS